MGPKNDTNELIYIAETELQHRLQKIIMVTKGKKWGGIKQEFGINIYTLPYIKQITNKDLLQSIGNYTQYFVITQKRKNMKKNVCRTESLCCTLETNTTL